MSRDPDSDDDGYSCMELPTLIKQLRSVLDQYPDDGQILKELIQNAEDAEASEVKILYDGRQIHPQIDPRLLKKRKYLSSLQAPALCVYNNALFTEKDWKGIKMLHNSIKEEEPLKVGRFGLGFKSVFHVTDFPCIVSGDSVLFLNPHDRNSDRVCYMKKLDNLDNDTRQILGKVIDGTFDFSSARSSYPGTLFWFPLRTEESELSDNLYTDKKAMDLFEAFKVEAPITLLFLKFIERIQLFTSKLSLELVFLVQLSEKCLQTVRSEKEAFIDKVKELNGRIPPSSIQNRLFLDVEMNDLKKNITVQQEWLVINHYKGGDISDKLRDLNSDPSLSYCPYVGLAVSLEKQCPGHVFCFLPLPLGNRSPTGLPVHVNGFFALSQNRRYVKWPTADQVQNQAHTDKAIQWNSCLVSEVLPEVYCSILKEVVKYSKSHGNPEYIQKQVYSLIPALNDIEINWRPLMSSVIEQIFSIALFFTHNSGGKWIQLQDTIFLDETDKATAIISELCIMYNENLVNLPSTLLSTLRTAHISHIIEVSREKISMILRSDNKYICLPKEKKLATLKYLHDYQYLSGLQLLPVADGTFVEFGVGETVYFCFPNEVQFFPGIERRFIATEISSDVQEILQRLPSQGARTLDLLSPDVFPQLLQTCLSHHFPDGNAELSTTVLTIHWLRQVWNYISQHGIDVKSKFCSICIVPEIDKLECGKLHSTNHIFIAQSVSMETLPPHLGDALRKLGIINLGYIPEFVLKTSNVMGEVIQYPTQTGVLNALAQLKDTHFASSIAGFNSLASREEKQVLVNYLNHVSMLPPNAWTVLKKLELFLDTNLSDCDIESVKILSPDETLPVPYPERYIKFSKSDERLALALGAVQVTLKDVCLKVLTKIRSEPHFYTHSQVVLFMEFLMKKHPSYLHAQNMKILATDIRFISSIGGTTDLRASDLFDDECFGLKSLFLGEDRFPASQHVQTCELRAGLRLIGLKSEKDVSPTDIISVAKSVEEMNAKGNRSHAESKMASLISFLETDKHQHHSSVFSELQKYKCIPCMQRNHKHYPTNLPFKGETASAFLSSTELFSSRYLSIIGSVSPLARKMPETVEHVLNLSKLPPPCLVIEHLRNVSEYYQSKDHHIYSGLLSDIYTYLESKHLSSQEVMLMQNTRSVFTEDRFQFPKSVYLIRKDTDLNLKPYRFQLPSFLDQWRSLLSESACHKEQSHDMLTTVLQEIYEKHEELKTTNTKNEHHVQQDLKLVIQIIGKLKNHPSTYNNLYLPVHQDHNDFLVLLPVKQCTYCNADWLKDQTNDDEDEDDDNIHFVHKDIPESTAQQLGVCPLTERVMGDTDDFDMDYHQSEPLTRRLKNLLHDYTDGFSVPKELIQNADDAGATEVCFMYDERLNLDARTSLMDERMAALQGPAFWAYNDAAFTETDFKNIKELSGATKEEDTTKVGRFGLGFNSVYNLTDVPSFISKNSAVVFDPHKIHLGRCGLKANLKTAQNQKMLRKMSGQFKPFEGIFGCHLKKCKGVGDICPGTLFRFPLRTEQQASTSEIKDLYYSKHEMERFIQVFTEGCGNLLLFTQNVKSLKFFHLSANGEAHNAELLLHVQKNIHKRSILPGGLSLHEQSILSYAANEWEILTQQKDAIRISEVIDMRVEINDTDMTKEHDYSDSPKTVRWKSTWVTGFEESGEFALSKSLKGLLPLGSVAVPLKMNCGIPELQRLDECPYGFYTEGHFFCFLPLPVKIPFPVHINATFALTSDRRQLCRKTEDDKRVLEAEWNEVLCKDVVSRAYVAALEDLEIAHASSVTQYYALWPTVDAEYRDIVTGVYKIISYDNPKVFLGVYDDHITKVSFDSVRFLDPSIRSITTIGDIAYKATSHFWSSRKDIVVDIPQDLLRCFFNTGLGRELDTRIISVYDFYRNIFFQNIEDPYWSTEERNHLTLYALKCEMEDIHELVKVTSCIPTKPSGKLKQPNQLIHPDGECAGMFSDDDECFPHGNSFCDISVLRCLCKLGMTTDVLPWECLVERAKSVETCFGNNIRAGCKRGGKIIRYLAKKDFLTNPFKEKRRIDDCPEDIRHELGNTAFLPVLQRPSSWSFDWKAERLLSSPRQLYMPETSNLVCCSHPVLSTDALEDYGNFTHVFVWIGVNQVEDIDIETITKQILCISKTLKSSDEQISFRNVDRVLKDIYEFMDKKCDTADTDSRTQIQQTLGGREIIWTEKKMLKPDQVAFHLPISLSPYLYRADMNIQSYKSFLLTIGVKEKFDLHDLLQVMAVIVEETGIEKLNEENLQCFGRITHQLVQLEEEIHNMPGLDIQLPDTEGTMYSAKSLCFNNCSWIDDDDSMKFIHPCVPETVGRWFGVKEKREADLVSHMSPFFSAFGQREKLTSRLNRILSGYPCDSSIMKELLQNADDAQATELMFIKDFRYLPTEKLFSDEMKPLQGPAFSVYNNSFFTENDLTGIQNLGEGSKVSDPIQTGQYGVGFNAVYHLTDVPSFMTVGPGIEKTICALDPHLSYVPRATTRSPGIQIKNLQTLRGKYKDSFSGYLEDKIQLQSKGTLFRFPLRTAEMAQESDISKKQFTLEDIEKLLNDFKSEMFDCLLFLHNVKKITIAKIENEKLEVEYCVEVLLNDSDILKQQGFISHLKTQAEHIKDPSMGIGLDSVSPLESQLSMQLKDSEGKQQDWMVFHHSGFSRDKDIPVDLIRAWENGKIGLLPRGGVAVPGKNVCKFKGKAFCILPLPVPTGLPVHVNGHFALDYEARKNICHGENDYRSAWNKHIIDAIIVPCYVLAMQSMKIKSGSTTENEQKHHGECLNLYNSFFPDTHSTKSEDWAELVKAFYSDVVLKRRQLFGVVRPVKGYFSDCKKDKEHLQVKTKWVSVLNDNGYHGYLDELKSYFPAKKAESSFRSVSLSSANTSSIQYDTGKSQWLQEILSDLNMKVIKAPQRIYQDVSTAGKEGQVKYLTPENVVIFLKSHSSDNPEKCNLGDLPKNLTNTVLQRVETVTFLTKFCKMFDNFETVIDDLPLAVDSSMKLCRFTSCKPLFVTQFTDLLTGSPDLFLIRDMVKLYSKYNAKSPCLKMLDINSIVPLLAKTLKPQILGIGKMILWADTSDFPSKKWLCCFWEFLFEALDDKLDNVDYVRECLSRLGEWSLFPGKDLGSNTPLMLYPIRDSQLVLDMRTVTPVACVEALQSIVVPVIDTSVLESSLENEKKRVNTIVSLIAGNWSTPGSVLRTLQSLDFTDKTRLSACHCETLLDYFSKNLDKLRSQQETRNKKHAQNYSIL